MATALQPQTHDAGGLIEVTPDVACQQILIVNVYFVGRPGAKRCTG